MKKNILIIFIVLFFLSACTHTDVSSSNEIQNEQMNQDSSIDESDNQLRKQTFKWQESEYLLSYLVSTNGLPEIERSDIESVFVQDPELFTIGKERWLRLKVQVSDEDMGISRSVVYYLYWNPDSDEFIDVFANSGLFEASYEHSLLMVDKTADNRQFLFKSADAYEYFYVNLYENHVYNLDRLTDNLALAVLYDGGVFCLTGLDRPREEDIATGGMPALKVQCNYGECGVLRKLDAGGDKAITILGFGAQDLREGEMSIRVSRRDNTSYEELIEQYSTRVWIQMLEGWSRFEKLESFSQINGTEIPFSETGVPIPDAAASIPIVHPTQRDTSVDKKHPYQLEGLEGIYVQISDDVYEKAGYGEYPSTYKLEEGAWERLPDVSYIDTLVIDNEFRHDVDYLLAMDGDEVINVVYNHKTEQDVYVRVDIINGRTYLKIRPSVEIEVGDGKEVPYGFHEISDGRYAKEIEVYYLEWNPETERFEDIFAGSGLWEYACAGSISLEKVSEDGQYFLFEIRVPAQTDEDEISDKYIFERGGTLVPARDSNMEAWLALDYNYSGH